MVRKTPQKLVLSQFVGLPELCSNTVAWDDSASSLVFLVGNCVLSHAIRTNLQTRLAIGSMKRALTAIALGEKYCALASAGKSQYPNVHDPEISIFARHDNTLVSTLCPSFGGRVQSLRFSPGDLYIVALASNALEFEVWDWAQRVLVLGKGTFPLPICDLTVTEDEVTASCVDVIVSKNFAGYDRNSQGNESSEPHLWLMGTFKGFCGICHGRETCRDFLYALTASGVLCVATFQDRAIKKWVDLRLEGLGVRAARTRVTVFGKKGKVRVLKSESLEHLGTLPITAGDCIEALWSWTQNRLSCVYRNNSKGLTIVVWNVRNPRKIKRFRVIKYRSTYVKSIVILPEKIIRNLIVIPACTSMIITGNGKLKLASVPAGSKSKTKAKPLTKRLLNLEVINLTVGKSVSGWSIFVACTNGHVKAFSLTWLRIWDNGYLTGRRILHLSAGNRLGNHEPGVKPGKGSKWVVVSTLDGRCCFLDGRTGMLISDVEIPTSRLKFGIRLVSGCLKLLTWGQESFWVHRITCEAILESNPLQSPVVDMHETEFVEVHPSAKFFLSAGSTENYVRT
jgi:hypothetical protein